VKNNRRRAKQLFRKTLGAVTGLDPDMEGPLGSVSVKGFQDGTSLPCRIFQWASGAGAEGSIAKGSSLKSEDGNHNEDLPQENLLWEAAENGKEIFCSYYSREENSDRAKAALAILENEGVSPEEKAKTISGIWAPETEMPEEDIIRRWRLKEVVPNPAPIQPTEVVLQLNALYTLPETDQHGSLAEYIPADKREIAGQVLTGPGRKLADYDHPVHLFEEDEKHELIQCLRELEKDIAFEKEKEVLPREYSFPVLLSVSVTHVNLDGPCGTWILEKLRSLRLSHISVFVLTEEVVKTIKNVLIDNTLTVYSVFGKYGVHFNALKYTQLLMEKAYGIRAGFKLDTDEGIRSKDLFAATGRTWLTTLCHTLWGGKALDWRGREVELVFNLGEYINSKDIDALGYSKAMREPDVKASPCAGNTNLFFNKGAAHAKATALYNHFNLLEDHISHTVVKGGGYGITNEGLRKFRPFTFSLVGRAEDQQFYFSGLSKGARGIFHPDLRIAHYKGAVASSEKKTEASRFLGDMYRLILFQYLAGLTGVKEDIDPMPGVFAGELGRAQAIYHLLYKASYYYSSDRTELGDELLKGWTELNDLIEHIKSGEILELLRGEQRQWEEFVKAEDTPAKAELQTLFEKSRA